MSFSQTNRFDTNELYNVTSLLHCFLVCQTEFAHRLELLVTKFSYCLFVFLTMFMSCRIVVLQNSFISVVLVKNNVLVVRTSLLLNFSMFFLSIRRKILIDWNISWWVSVIASPFARSNVALVSNFS